MPHYTVGCNYISLSEIPACGTKVPMCLLHVLGAHQRVCRWPGTSRRNLCSTSVTSVLWVIPRYTGSCYCSTDCTHTRLYNVSPIQIWPAYCFYVPSAALRSERKSNKRFRFESLETLFVDSPRTGDRRYRSWWSYHFHRLEDLDKQDQGPRCLGLPRTRCRFQYRLDRPSHSCSSSGPD